MGRAIVREPQVFLMDEPLSNLDAKLRVQMRAEIAKLQHELGVTTIYVTHDQIEAMTMGDRVAVMSMGKLQQVDTPQHLYDEPFNLFVASFIGTPPMNLVEAVVSVDGEASTSASGRRRSPPARPRSRAIPGFEPVTGSKVVLGIRAEDLHPAGDRPGFPTFNARIDLVEALGSGLMAYFTIDAVAGAHRRRTSTWRTEVGAATATASSRRAAEPDRPLPAARRVADRRLGPVAVDPDNLHFFDLETGAAAFR